ncbi:unnamed protein product [Amoebophrya sp. A120]|nr:unnamed protein product [Amoebophrya sp. A120]|eukprot:GSA120T00022247001.1
MNNFFYQLGKQVRGVDDSAEPSTTEKDGARRTTADESHLLSQHPRQTRSLQQLTYTQDPPLNNAQCTENEDGDEECGVVEKGMMLTTEGYRVAVAEAVLTKYGAVEVFNYIFSLPLTYLANLKSVTIPLATGCNSFLNFAKCEKFEVDSSSDPDGIGVGATVGIGNTLVVSCKLPGEQTGTNGQKLRTELRFQRQYVFPNDFTNHAVKDEVFVVKKDVKSGVVLSREKALMSNAASLEQTFQQTNFNVSDTICPFGIGKCSYCTPKVIVKANTFDPPTGGSNIAFPSRANLFDYCANLVSSVTSFNASSMTRPKHSCSISEYNAYQLALNRQPASVSFFQSLDCDSDKYVDPGELQLFGICGSRLIANMLEGSTLPQVQNILGITPSRNIRNLAAHTSTSSTASNASSIVYSNLDKARIIATGRVCETSPNLCQSMPLEVLLKELEQFNVLKPLMKDENLNTRNLIADIMVKKCDFDSDSAFTASEIDCAVRKIIPMTENLEKAVAETSATEEPAKAKILIPANQKVAFRATELKLPSAIEMSETMKKKLFTKLDFNNDGKVTLQEIEKETSSFKLPTRASASLITRQEYVSNPSLYNPQVAGSATVAAEFSECMFLYRDTNGDGKLSAKEAFLPLAQVSLLHEKTCGGRMLLEELVHKVERRRNEEKRFLKEIEIRSEARASSSSTLTPQDASAQNKFSSYYDWLQNRNLKAGEKLKHERRQLATSTNSIGGVTHDAGTTVPPTYFDVSGTSSTILTELKTDAFFASLPDAELKKFQKVFQFEIDTNNQVKRANDPKQELKLMMAELKAVAESGSCHDYRRVLEEESGEEIGVVRTVYENQNVEILQSQSSTEPVRAEEEEKRRLSSHLLTPTPHQLNTLQCFAQNSATLQAAAEVIGGSAISKNSQTLLNTNCGSSTFICSVFFHVNTDASMLSQIPSPLQPTAQMQRRLLEEARGRRLKVYEVGGPHQNAGDDDAGRAPSGASVSTSADRPVEIASGSSADAAKIVPPGRSSTRRKLLENQSEANKRIETRLLSTQTCPQDGTSQVLYGSEVQLLAELMKLSVSQIEKACLNAREEMLFLAPKKMKCMTGRLLEGLEVEFQENNDENQSSSSATTSTRFLAGHAAQNTYSGYKSSTYSAIIDSCVLTACQVNRLLSPSSEIAIRNDFDAMTALENGDTEYCAIPTRKRRALEYAAVSTAPTAPSFITPLAAALNPTSFEFNNLGQLMKTSAKSHEVSFAEFAQYQLNAPINEAPEACQLLALQEKMLPISTEGVQQGKYRGVTLFNTTGTASNLADYNKDLTANLKSAEFGPGCLEECDCIHKRTGAFTCTLQDYEQCPCMLRKKQCHKEIVDLWIRKGGLDFTDILEETHVSSSLRRVRRELKEVEEEVEARSAAAARAAARGTTRITVPTRQDLHDFVYQKRIVDKNLRKVVLARSRTSGRAASTFSSSSSSAAPTARRTDLNQNHLQQHILNSIKRDRKLLTQQSQSSKDHETSTNPRKLYPYKIYNSNLTAAIQAQGENATSAEQQCGDDYGENCPCDPFIDGMSCVGNKALNYYQIASMSTVKEFGSHRNFYLTDFALPCPDFTQLYHELEERLELIYTAQPTTASSGATTNWLMSEHEYQLQREILNLAVDKKTGKVYKSELQKLSPLLRDQLFNGNNELALLAEPCVPLLVLEKFQREVAIRNHPIDLFEAEAACKNGKLRCSLDAESEIFGRKLFDEALSESASVFATSSAGMTGMAKEFTLDMVKEFLGLCKTTSGAGGGGEKKPDPQFCRMASLLVRNVENKCGTTSSPVLSIQSLYALSSTLGGEIANSFLLPDRNGFVTVPECAVYFGFFKNNFDPEEAVAYCLQAFGVNGLNGKILASDLETKGRKLVADSTTAEDYLSCEPATFTADKDVITAITTDYKATTHSALSTSAQATPVTARTSTEIFETLSNEEQKRKIFEAREKIATLMEQHLYSTRRRELQMKQTNVDKVSISNLDILQFLKQENEVTTGLDLQQTRVFADIISDLMPLLEIQKNMLSKLLGEEMAEIDGKMATAPTTLQRETHGSLNFFYHDELQRFTNLATHCSNATIALSKAITMLDSLENDARNTTAYPITQASSYYSISYVKKTTKTAQTSAGAAHPDRLTSSDDELVAFCVSEMLFELPKVFAGFLSSPGEKKICEPSEKVLQSCIPDVMNCVERSCAEKAMLQLDFFPTAVVSKTTVEGATSIGRNYNPEPVCRLSDTNQILHIDGPLLRGRKLGTKDTIIPSELNGAGNLQALPKNHPFYNKHDCYFLKSSGCLPWQLSFEKFKLFVQRELLQKSAKNSKQLLGMFDLAISASNQEDKLADAFIDDIQDLKVYTSSTGTQTQPPKLSQSELVQAKNSLLMRLNERSTNCLDHEKCDKTKSDYFLPEEDLAVLFNFFDKRSTGCVDVFIEDTFDCDSLAEDGIESDLVLIEDVNDDGAADTNTVSITNAKASNKEFYHNSGAKKVYYPALCRKQKMKQDKIRQMNNFVFDKLLMRSAVREAKQNAMGLLQKDMDAYSIQWYNFNLALAAVGGTPTFPLEVEFMKGLFSTTGLVSTSSSTTGSAQHNSDAASTSCRLFYEAMLLPTLSKKNKNNLKRAGLDCKYRLEFKKREMLVIGGNNIADDTNSELTNLYGSTTNAMSEQVNLKNVTAMMEAEFTANEFQQLRTVVEELSNHQFLNSMPNFGTEFDWAGKCAKIVDVKTQGGTTEIADAAIDSTDLDSDGLNDNEELAKCLIAVLYYTAELNSEQTILKLLKKIQNGLVGGTREVLMNTVLPTSYLTNNITHSLLEKEEIMTIPESCYVECFEPHIADRPTAVCKQARVCGLLKKRGHPLRLQNARLKAKQSRMLVRAV